VRRSKLPEGGQGFGDDGAGADGLRPLRAARLAAAVAGGPARGEGALTGARIAVYWDEDAAYYKVSLLSSFPVRVRDTSYMFPVRFRKGSV